MVGVQFEPQRSFGRLLRLSLTTTLFLVATDVYAQAESCLRAHALVNTRFPEQERAAWNKQLENCSAGSGDTALKTLESIAKEREQVEITLGTQAGESGDLKSQVKHFEFVFTLNPSKVNGDRLKNARDALAKRTAAQIRAYLANGKANEAIKLLNDPETRALNNSEITDAVKAIEHAPYDRMVAASKIGHFDQALDELKTVFESQPKAELPLAGLPLQSNLWLRWSIARNIATANALSIVEILVLLLASLWVIIRLWRRYAKMPVVVLRDFDNNTLSPGIEQAIQAMLINLSRGSAISSSLLFKVTRPVVGVPLPVDISNVLPASASWMQLIPGLIARVFPRRVLPITGSLHQDPVNGAGITVHVVTRKGVHLSESFWRNDFCGDDKDGVGHTSHYQLSEYVAIWLLFAFSPANFEILGTREWRSYALFRAGANAAPDDAKTFYLRALRVDDGLQAARLNLGLLANGPERPLILNLFATAANNAHDFDATRYQARYSLSSLHYDVFGVDTALKDMEQLFGDIGKACVRYNLSGQLRTTALASLNELRLLRGDLQVTEQIWKPQPFWQRLWEFHISTRFCPLTLPPDDTNAFSLFVLGPSDGVRRRLWTGLKADPWLLFRHANWKRRGMIRAALDNYIAYLMPIARAMSLGLAVSKNRSNSAALQELQSLTLEEHVPRVLYNLACAYSLFSEGLVAQKQDASTDTKRGLDSLALALWLDRSIGQKVREDNSLKGLRNPEVVVGGQLASIKFESVVSRYMNEAPKPKTTLGQFAIIGEHFADLLSTMGISSPNDLRLKCATATKRQKLAQTLGAGEPQIKEWATILEMLDVSGVQAEHINLLSCARVFSLSELAAAKDSALHSSLSDWAKLLQLIAPSLTLVNQWILQAAHLQTKVT